MMNVATSEETRRWRALIADDQPDVLEALRLLLKGEGFQTDAVMSPAEVIEALRARDYDLLLMDLNYARDTTSGQEGLDLLNAGRIHQALDRATAIFTRTPREHAFTRAVAVGVDERLAQLARMANREWHVDGSQPTHLSDVGFDEAQSAFSSNEPPALIVPIKVNNEIAGLLGVAGRHPGDGFDADDMKFLDAAAEQ